MSTLQTSYKSSCHRVKQIKEVNFFVFFCFFVFKEQAEGNCVEVALKCAHLKLS